MRHHLAYILFLFFFPFAATSQNKDISRGNKHFEQLEFRDALNNYLKAFQKDKKNPETLHRIASCYFKLNDMSMAEKWYSVAKKSGNLKNEVLLNFIEASMQNKNYPEVKNNITVFLKQGGNEEKIVKYLEAITKIDKFYNDSADYHIKPCNEINTAGADFSPCYFNNGLVYVSEREHDKFSKSEFQWDQSHFLDFYYIAFQDKTNGTFKGHPEYFHQKLNSKYHEGPLSFNKNETLMAFTRNNFYQNKTKLSKDGTNKLKIFLREKTKNDWSEIKNFDYNNDEYSCGHPALNSDGKTMYFVSDMPGGFGGTDIWKAEYKNGKWINVINLGNKINTAENEMFPTLFNDSILFFSSNGHAGLGGLDIFKINLNQTAKENAVNIGYPINSPKDDFGMICDSVCSSGYFSSNRGNKDGANDDIYFFKKSNNTITILVVDADSKMPLPNGEIISLKNNVKNNLTTDKKGEIKINLKPVPEQITAFYKGYNDSTRDLRKIPLQQNQSSTIIIPLRKKNYYIEVSVIENDTKKPLENVDVVVQFESTPALTDLQFKTENNILKNFPLKDYKFENHLQLRSIVSREGYLSKTEEFKTQLFNDTVIKIVISLDKLKKGIDIGKLISLNPIYFDVDKYDIRKDAADELDKIVKVMQQNPTIVIELGSHTDCRAGARYNLLLSDKRAKASAAYIISKGISKKRIYGKGFGESKLLNNCQCEGKKESNCSEEEHQLNRRTEFRIVEIK